jgi:hypothetical protein
MLLANNRYVHKRLVCPICGNVSYVVRMRGRNRKAGHVKHLWCYVCQERIGYIETDESSNVDGPLTDNRQISINHHDNT